MSSDTETIRTAARAMRERAAFIEHVVQSAVTSGMTPAVIRSVAAWLEAVVDEGAVPRAQALAVARQFLKDNS